MTNSDSSLPTGLSASSAEDIDLLSVIFSQKVCPVAFGIPIANEHGKTNHGLPGPGARSMRRVSVVSSPLQGDAVITYVGCTVLPASTWTSFLSRANPGRVKVSV